MSRLTQTDYYDCYVVVVLERGNIQRIYCNPTTGQIHLYNNIDQAKQGINRVMGDAHEGSILYEIHKVNVMFFLKEKNNG